MPLPDLSTSVAVAGPTTLTLADFLRTLHRRQRLLPLLLEAATEKLLVETARRGGLEISTEQMQQTVNRFRQNLGMREAKDTNRWLADQGLSLPDLETTLEADLLIAGLQEQLTATRAEEVFAAQPADFARARLRLLQAASEGEVQELLSQINDEGRDFADLARQHSLHLPSRAAGGSLLPLCRCEMPTDLAEAVFKAQPGAVVGPLADQMGYSLFLVEELRPAELDLATTNLIRRFLFDTWLRERLAEVRMDLSWLDQADESA